MAFSRPPRAPSSASSSRRSSARTSGASAAHGQRSTNGTSSPRASKSAWRRHGTALPSWTDLEHTNARRYAPKSGEAFLEQVPTWKFALVVILLAASFTGYVWHVNATQQLLADVQQAEAENQSLHIQYNYLQGERARQTGPSVIYERARALGLEETVAFGPSIPREALSDR
ncbi:MAG: hypothetical protein PPP56_01745 [Longimonas sp.]|uniref:hypothetical protein n=1 Tax=Longimonas sp. TaxID=2039626 RepID=UPI00336486CB